MGRKNRRKAERGRKIHVNKYLSRTGQTKAGKKSKHQKTVPPIQMQESAVQSVLESVQQEALVCLQMQPRRAEVWFANLGSHYDTSVQSGSRPVFIISNDVANHFSQTVTVLPMTTKFKKKAMPTHVMLPAEFCIVEEPTAATEPQHLEDSMILAEQVTTIDKTALLEFLGRVADAQKLKEIDTAVAVQLGMVS